MRKFACLFSIAILFALVTIADARCGRGRIRGHRSPAASASKAPAPAAPAKSAPKKKTD